MIRYFIKPFGLMAGSGARVERCFSREFSIARLSRATLIWVALVFVFSGVELLEPMAGPRATPEDLVILWSGVASSLDIEGGELFWVAGVGGEFCPPYAMVRKLNLATGNTSIFRRSCAVSPKGVSADSFHVYYGNFTSLSIERQRLDGSLLESVAATVGSISDILGDTSAIYFSDTEGVKKYDKSTGSVTTLSAGASANRLALSSNYVYWTDKAAGTVWRVSVSGGGAELVTFFRTALDQIAFGHVEGDGTENVYIVDDAGIHRIRVEPFTTAKLVSTAAGEVIGDIAANSGYLYWTSYQTAAPSSTGQLRRIPLSGGGAETMASGLNKPTTLILSDTHAYWSSPVRLWRLPLSSAPQTVDLSLEAIGATQGIQNWANDVPLVADKVTYVRVYPTVTSVDTSATALLYGFRDGVALPGSPLSGRFNSIVVKAIDPDRGSTRDNFSFWLPPDWRTGTVTLRAEINPDRAVSESDYDNNGISITRTFRTKSPVCVAALPLAMSDGRRFQKDAPGFQEIVDRFLSLWPVPEVYVLPETATITKPFGGEFNLPGDGGKVIYHLWDYDNWHGDPDYCSSRSAGIHYMGMVHPDTNTGNQLGYASLWTYQSYVKMQWHHRRGWPEFARARGGATMAQELAHNLNGDPTFNGNRLGHVDCRDPSGVDTNYPYDPNTIANAGVGTFWGFDSLSRTPIEPASARDFMSYCEPAWVSDYNWKGVMDRVNNGRSVSKPRRSPTVPQIILAGLVEHDGEPASFPVLYKLDPEIIDLGNWNDLIDNRNAHLGIPTDYAVDFLGAGDAVLASYPAYPTSTHGRGVRSEPLQPGFLLAIDEISGLEALRITMNGVEQVRQKLSANPPTVQLMEPTGGTVAGALTIRWQASDPDGDPLLSVVQYSADGGANWTVLGFNLEGQSLIVQDTSALPGSASALVRVVVRDGYYTAFDTSTPFEMPNHGPAVTIRTPRQRELVPPDAQVIFAGVALDPEEGPLSGTALEWLVDGALVATGSEGTTRGLVLGEHTITLQARDSLGNSGSASVTIFVGDALPVPISGTALLLVLLLLAVGGAVLFRSRPGTNEA